jgi:hypothetical protein
MKRRGGIITHVETYEHTRARARRIAVRSCCDARVVQKSESVAVRVPGAVFHLHRTTRYVPISRRWL